MATPAIDSVASAGELGPDYCGRRAAEPVQIGASPAGILVARHSVCQLLCSAPIT